MKTNKPHKTNLTYKIVLSMAVVLLSFTACKKEEPVNNPPGTPPPQLIDDTLYISLAQNQKQNGLIESTANSNFVSLYDVALASILFTNSGEFDRAEMIFDFFTSRIDNELKVSPGGYGQFRDTTGIPLNNQPHRWLGDNAWLLIALNNYYSWIDTDRYDALKNELESWIRSLQDVDGGLIGGFNADGTEIGKITEGNIDAFNAVDGYDNFHKELLNYLKNHKWDSVSSQLMAWPENPQYRYALDVFPWSYCIFEDYPDNTLVKADIFKTDKIPTLFPEMISGYCFDEDKDVIWYEGTGQMVVAFNKSKSGSEYNFYLNELEKVIIIDTSGRLSGIPYASNPGTHYGNSPLWVGADTKPCISSTAWYLLGKYNIDPFKVNYIKNIPAQDRFWE